MIWNVVRIGLLRVWHGRVELLLLFAAPIVFFTIFALMFDGQFSTGSSPVVGVALVDEDGSELSETLRVELAKQKTLRVHVGDGGGEDSTVFSAEAPARELVLTGALSLAIVIPKGWADSLTSPAAFPESIRVLADTSDPVAPQVVSALIQQVTGQLLAERAREQGASISAFGQGLPAELAAMVTASIPKPVRIDVIDLLADDKANPIVSMYAAGIAVMFMLFSTTGQGGSLLEEEESQTLERLLCSGLTMTQLLAGKWLWLVLLGTTQVSVMFVWAQLVFGVDLIGHLPGFALITIVTAAAAASLSLTLASACKTRLQLNAVSIILVLCMSAMGGSMVPRYVMSETMQQVGRVTFNAWALDGYMKVFWRDRPLVELGPELAVLGVAALVLFATARRLARRWERD